MESIREFMDDMDKILSENYSDSDVNPFASGDEEKDVNDTESNIDNVITDLLAKLEESGDEEKAKKVLELSEKFVVELKEIIEATEAETVDYNADVHSDEFEYPRS